MATRAHCAYCFECLSASFTHKQPPSLQQIQGLWAEYTQDPQAIKPCTPINDDDNRHNENDTEQEQEQEQEQQEPPSPSSSHPLFVTWNKTTTRTIVSGFTPTYKSLRGCIGTFQPTLLSTGLASYALTSAFSDHRFSPVAAAELPSLSCAVTLLTNFSEPTPDPMDWTLGKHGIRIRFRYKGRDGYGATYLPDVAVEQGWDKDEAVGSLLRKAGWEGKRVKWREDFGQGGSVQGFELVRYEGRKVELGYQEWKAFRDWVDAKSGK